MKQGAGIQRFYQSSSSSYRHVRTGVVGKTRHLQLRRAVREQAPSDPGVCGAQDLVVGVAGEGDALQH